jgi:hypothetical protein
MASADPKIPLVPHWLINWVTHKMAHFCFDVRSYLCCCVCVPESVRLQLLQRTACSVPGSEYAARIAAKPHIYAEVERRLQQARTRAPRPSSAAAAAAESPVAPLGGTGDSVHRMPMEFLPTREEE